MSSLNDTPCKEQTDRSGSDMNAFRVLLGQRIRERREQLGIPRKELADAIGIKVAGFAHYESGRNDIAASDLWKVAEVLRVSIGYFFDQVPPSRPTILIDGFREAGLEVTEIQDLVDAFILMRRKRLIGSGGDTEETEFRLAGGRIRGEIG